MKLNWNFQRGGGSRKKFLPWGRYGYFLEIHNNNFVLLTSFIRPFADLSLIISQAKKAKVYQKNCFTLRLELNIVIEY